MILNANFRFVLFLKAAATMHGRHGRHSRHGHHGRHVLAAVAAATAAATTATAATAAKVLKLSPSDVYDFEYDFWIRFISQSQMGVSILFICKSLCTTESFFMMS